MTVPSASELDEALEAITRRPDPRPAEVLGMFVYELLGSAADARVLPMPANSVLERAASAALTADNAGTELAKLLGLLTTGARSGPDCALLSAFAAHGCSVAWAKLSESELARQAETQVARLDWLEVASDLRITACLLRVLPERERAAFLEALQRAVQRDDDALDAADPALRARVTWRLSVLSGTRSDAAKRALRTFRNKAKDPATRALSAMLLGELARDEGITQAVLCVAGVSRTPSRSLPIALLRWLSGLALLSALHRFACFVVALRRELEIELRGESLCVRGRTLLLGRTLRSSEACYEIWRVTGAFRRARFALLRSVIGVLSLSLGILLGGYLVFDGARGGAPLLLLIGAGLVAVGSSVDLLLNVLLPARAARVDVQVDLRDAGSLRLGRVQQADADRLLEALTLKLSR